MRTPIMKIDHGELSLLREGRELGFLDRPGLLVRRLVKYKLARQRYLDDEVRGRRLETGDHELTSWGQIVAANYAHGAERLPAGTPLNHRILGYRDGTVVMADESGEVCVVDAGRPLTAQPGGSGGSWIIPLTGDSGTFGSARQAWYLRNLLDMDIELTLGEFGSADDFCSD